ncbi:MAG TPA: hypothetical protein EYQ42_04680 [Thiotrichaceae bacterium]|nr:hypothetical protein [Thiotrichaceae bacterium]
MSSNTSVTLDDLVPEKQIPEKYPHLYTKESWRWAVAQRKHNGLARAFRKIGKNVFVNVVILAECMDEQPAD